VLVEQAVSMFGAGAILGPLLDHQHSRFDVLHYEHPLLLRLPPDLMLPDTDFAPWLRSLVDTLFLRESAGLETAPWVPLLFGSAAVIIGLGHTQGDDAVIAARGASAGAPRTGYEPAWSAVVLAITAFALQYALSGVLPYEAPAWLAEYTFGLDALLAGLAFAIYAAVDGTEQGLLMAALTAVAGPVTEMTLINVLHLYHYTQPTFNGVPTWIPWVYFAGSPAVGSLCRAVRARIRRERVQQEQALAAVTQRSLPGTTVTSQFTSAAAAAKMARSAAAAVSRDVAPVEQPQSSNSPPGPPEMPAPAPSTTTVDCDRTVPGFSVRELPARVDSADEEAHVDGASLTRLTARRTPAPLREAMRSSARVRDRIDSALEALASEAQERGLTDATQRWLGQRSQQLTELRRALAEATHVLRSAAAVSAGVDDLEGEEVDAPSVDAQLRDAAQRLELVESMLRQYSEQRPTDDLSRRAVAIGMRMLRAELADVSDTLARLNRH